MSQALIKHCIDSRHWHNFVYRPDDIVIASWGKSGTTWMQQIVGQLLFRGDPNLVLSEKSVWLDASWPAEQDKLRFLDKQRHRRFIKTHLPPTCLPRSSKAKYIYVGRDARDAVWSLHHHLCTLSDDVYDRINSQAQAAGRDPLLKPDEGIYRFWLRWMEDDTYPTWPFWSHTRDWWNLRNSKNILAVHFSDLKTDMPAGIRSIAGFLGISPSGEEWERILEYCSFDWMKAHPENVLPPGMSQPQDGKNDFINRGCNQRWKSVLSERDIIAYENKAREELGEECANWLFHGEPGTEKERTASQFDNIM